MNQTNKIWKIILLLTFVLGRSAWAQEYTDGVFILNEDWFGHNNSTLNFLNPETGEFDYHIVQSNTDNGKLSLGCTAQFGAIYGGNMYVISKQDQDPGERNLTGGRVVVLDAKTMKIKKSIPVIAEKNGKSAADGRSFVGVNETKGYIGTSNGIYIMNLTNFEITTCISGSENPLITGEEDNADGVGPLYRNQIGMMIRTHDYVFAIQQDKGILVINPETDTIEQVIEGCFSTMTQSKDGTLWVGINSNLDFQEYPYGTSGEKWEGNQLLKLNPATLSHEILEMPHSTGVNQTWYAWTAGSLCASAKENVLYFTFNPDKWSWFTCSFLYMYDIDQNQFIRIYDSVTEERYFYGAGIRINPLDDKLYAALYLDNIDQTYFFYRMDNEGNRLRQYEPIQRYWFPAMFIFPDNHAPQVAEFTPLTINDGQPVDVDLSAMASDNDNLAAAITQRVIANDNESVLSAAVKNRTLTLRAKDNVTGTAQVTVRFNSNGKTEDRTLTVHLSVSGLGIHATTPDEIHVFALNGEIHVRGLHTKTPVQVFNLRGQLLREQIIDGTRPISGFPAGNIYIVKIGNKHYKVVL
jgi:hypothetical protein